MFILLCLSLACLQTPSSPQSKSEKKPFTEGRGVGSVHRLPLTLLSYSSRFLRALQRHRTQLRLLNVLTKNLSNLKTCLSPCKGSVLKTFAYSYAVSEYEGMFIEADYLAVYSSCHLACVCIPIWLAILFLHNVWIFRHYIFPGSMPRASRLQNSKWPLKLNKFHASIQWGSFIYCADTRTWTLGRRLSNHKVCWKHSSR